MKRFFRSGLMAFGVTGATLLLGYAWMARQPAPIRMVPAQTSAVAAAQTNGEAPRTGVAQPAQGAAGSSGAPGVVGMPSDAQGAPDTPAAQTRAGTAQTRTQTGTGASPAQTDESSSALLQSLFHASPRQAAPLWLIVGTDSRAGESARSDTMLLAKSNAAGTRVLLISVPRDMRVAIRGYGMTKVNHALAYGNLPLLRKTLDETFGFHIDHALSVDFDAFKELVDALGGVPMTVERAMDYDDASDGTHIHLRPGRQILDGKKALDYVRFRHDALADTGRMERQQKLLRAIVTTNVPPDHWFAVAKTAVTMPTHLHTDASVWEAVTALMHVMLSPHHTVVTEMMRGRNAVDPIDGLWYFYVDPRELYKVRAEIDHFGK
ncbi:LCP family protein [Ferroacidibacillus organovorans]|uniref:Cell envelope-related transcriptional attenuator domain-containing protein n=1 Tax=Ferroacidibacillus organovorans TaxID=1765683 RepID=A0A853KDI3_9BACL|nr:LCP family protein [Ferroacidibacillus organovorans]KYP81702.1 hypothetical protein AYJ22_06170 [Ferroacidibacillus organovorans]OAG94239.1 hypothetical protein AYW79_06380 [Ferroacidibacillus organovorans]